MTVNEIEIEARRILKDEESPYRWESGEIRDALQSGIIALNSIRPETRYVNGRLVDFVALPEVGATDQSFEIHPRFKDALVCFVVHKCYLDDDTDTANQALAESYLAKFNTKAQL